MWTVLIVDDDEEFRGQARALLDSSRMRGGA
jgi:FixJ family two-component response regulator